MSLTSYRAAPPRGPKCIQYSASFRERKLKFDFSRKSRKAKLPGPNQRAFTAELLCAVVDPGADQADLVLRQWLAFVLGRHHAIFERAGNGLNEHAFFAVPRSDYLAIFTPFFDGFEAVEAKFAFLFFFAMAFEAGLLENRFDVLGVGHVGPAGSRGNFAKVDFLIGSEGCCAQQSQSGQKSFGNHISLLFKGRRPFAQCKRAQDPRFRKAGWIGGLIERNIHTATSGGSLDVYLETKSIKRFYYVSFRVPGEYGDAMIHCETREWKFESNYRREQSIRNETFKRWKHDHKGRGEGPKNRNIFSCRRPNRGIEFTHVKYRG
jgi:hypothetical protein